jgi:hypothetical protein
MFVNDELKNFLETSSVVRLQSAVVAEWNMNIANNINQIGNYRHRPLESGSKYYRPAMTFDKADTGNFYTNATDADITVDGGYDDAGLPMLFTSKKEKAKMLYSLEDCFKKFRPRSGINKATYINSRYFHHANINMFDRPRYYMSDKNDGFKYWTSYRTEDGIERGIANKPSNGQYYIDDACPYITYKEPVPTNRLVFKMQTNVGNVDLGPFSNNTGSFPDPLYGYSNQTTPVNWKIQYLSGTNWVDAFSFNAASKRRNGLNVIGPDGYVELAYGLKVPERYRDSFVKAEEYTSTFFLPENSVNGYAYLIKENELDIGVYYIWHEGTYETFIPLYGWYLEEPTVDRLTNFVTDLTNPVKFTNQSSGKEEYREFSYIDGIRVVVETMNKADSTFDLIEISPRLTVDLSNKAKDFSIMKTAGDIGTNGLPVGQLLASTGSLKLFDYDQAFNSNNVSSIIKKYIANNIQIKFYDIIVNVNGYDYFVPIKTMYSEGFPESTAKDRSVALKLRDMFFYFESLIAPQTLLTNVSVSSAISMLLDSVGFSNYSFKRVDGEQDLIIPFFYISPDKSIAEVLNDLAISTQSSMFFDEYNNFIMMSKNYLMPTLSQRDTDMVLYGSGDPETQKLSNIVDIASQDNLVYNDGKITYQNRYIQKTYGSIKQASMIDQDKTWIYKPVLLWEVTGTENVKSVDNSASTQSNYVLSAIPLNSNLTADLPSVVNNKVVNNTVDLGEGVYWLTRNSGYFYANSEIIKYDAVQYNVSGIGNVWISNVQEYQDYFSKISFNGKIYPTGLIRIYSEPNYEILSGVFRFKNGKVSKHGRGQFGTSVVKHNAGLDPYWIDNDNVRGCTMKSEYLFGLTNQSTPTTPYEVDDAGADAESQSLAEQSVRNGIIKNFLANSYLTESKVDGLRSTQTGTIQSSAFILSGPSFSTTQTPIDFLSYVYKPLTNKFKHFGTRMRIIGKVENNENRGQTPIGSNTYYVVTGSTPNQSINVGGGSGGIAVMLNPETNNGYYFEIIALTENNINDYVNASEKLHNIIFYKIGKDPDSTDALPIKLWGGLSNIIVDDGKFTGQYRLAGEQNPTVYDLAVEYQDIGKIRRFFLYINNKLITTVDDEKPLPVYNNMALFTRGATRCMFENIYALTNNYSQNTSFALDTPVLSAIDDSEINANESFSKYAMSGIVQSTYLSGISPSEPPKYNMYFEEFGTIMREASYFNIRYDKAFPAIYAKLSPTFNRIKGYTVSGFRAGSYGAEFMIFNATDTALSLDETTGNYLRIQGVTFTQQSQSELTVDDYFSKTSDFSNSTFTGTNLIKSPLKASQDYEDIKVSRLTYGKNQFVLDAPYIQTQDDAKSLLSWIVSKVTKPRKSVGLDIFSMPILQLGDIVSIDYKDSDGVDQVLPSTARFVVYNIDYTNDSSGPKMTVHLSEVA